MNIMNLSYPQKTLLLAAFVGNIFYSLTKRSIQSSTPSLISELRLSKSQLGIISANFSFAYGFSKLAGGVLSDLLSAELLFLGGLLFGSFVNILISVFPYPSHISLLWLINGITQGVGGPALSKVVTMKFDSSAVSTVWTTTTFATNFGHFISPVVLSPSVQYGWKGPFLASGVSGVIVVIIIVIYFTVSYSNNISVPSTEHCVQSEKIKQELTNGQKITIWSKIGSSLTYLIQRAFQLCTVNLNCLLSANLLTYFIMKCVSEWILLYLIEHAGIGREESIEILLWSEVGGIVGSLMSGIISDGLNNRKALICLAFSILMLISIGLFGVFTSSYTPHAVHSILTSTCHPNHKLSDDVCLDQVSQPTNQYSFQSSCTRDSMQCHVVSTFEKIFHFIGSTALQYILLPMQFICFKMCQSLESSLHFMYTMESKVWSVAIDPDKIPSMMMYARLLKLHNNPIGIRMSLFLAGFGLNAPKALLLLLIAEEVPKEISGSITGICGMISQIGAGFAGIYLGSLIDRDLLKPSTTILRPSTTDGFNDVSGDDGTNDKLASPMTELTGFIAKCFQNEGELSSRCEEYQECQLSALFHSNRNGTLDTQANGICRMTDLSDLPVIRKSVVLVETVDKVDRVGSDWNDFVSIMLISSLFLIILLIIPTWIGPRKPFR